MIKVPHLKDYILELIDELERLKALGTFDAVTLLYDLYDIQNKYYKIYLAK